MHKFSWRTMLIFVVSLLLAIILLGVGTAYMIKLKQQLRQLSTTALFNSGALAASGRSSAAPLRNDSIKIFSVPGEHNVFCVV